jgi:excinuclease Cho
MKPGFGDPTRFEYPHHLRAAIDDLPPAPGVYVFHGEDGDLPLYIGKSINLRTRVLSHLRTAQEARMLRQTKRISYIRTTGEIGALLLEASMIKQQQPLLNQKLRRQRQLCSFSLRDGRLTVVNSKDVNFATEPELFGLFSSRHAALESLRQLADDNRLCYGALGLEKIPAGKPCFRAMLRLCGGVCRGDESLPAHQARFVSSLQGLKMVCWPYAGAVGLIERFEQEAQIHVVRNWCYLGSVMNVHEACQLDVPAVGFDADGYKILCKPILGRTVEIVVL